VSALLVVVFFSLAGQASAAPCWKKLLNDWYDGTIDKTYPVACYHQAIANMQDDLKLYSSASDDIKRALQRTVANAHATTTEAAQTTQAPVASPPATTESEPAGPAPTTTTTTKTPTTKAPVKHAPPPATTIAAAETGGDSVPLPLIVLGGIALLLVAVGAIGLVRRRMQDPGE
jgi:hypothetical protein